MKPSILDGGYEIVLANWPTYKRIVCSTHNSIPIEIPSHLYVLLNRMVLCNCIIEAESNFLLESIAACDPERDDVDLEMYFVANTAFLNYFDELINTLDIPVFHNITRQEHILPISLVSNDFDEELLLAPKTLRELVERYKQKKVSFENNMTIWPFGIQYFYICDGYSFSNCNVYSNKTYIQRRENASVIGKSGNDKRSKSNN